MEPHVPYRDHPGITPPRRPDVGASDLQLNGRALLDAQPFGSTERTPDPVSQPEHDRLWDLYAGEVRYADQQIAELLAGLAQRGTLANTIVVVTADHGEEFGEHGVYNHGLSLFEAVARVPLLVRLPGPKAPARIAAPVELAGLAPALLRELGVDPPASFHVGALPLRPAAVRADATAYCELFEAAKRIRLHEYALVTPAAKLLAAPDGGTVAYDVRADPLERVALADSTAAALRAGAQARRMRLPVGRPAEPIEVDEATRERLRELGYAATD